MPPFGLDTVLLGLLWYTVFLFSTCCHEAAHAWVAHRLGDPTAYRGGQVTLDPRPHIAREPVGTILLPLVSFALTRDWMMGWASAPYDPAWADRWPRRAAWMALAGPASNFSLALVAGISLRVGAGLGWFHPPEVATFSRVAVGLDGVPASLATVLSIAFSLNLVLGVFNLLPAPPLDGSAVLPLLLPDAWSRRWLEFVRQPMLMLAGILLAWRIFPFLFRPIHTASLNLLWPGLGYR